MQKRLLGKICKAVRPSKVHLKKSRGRGIQKGIGGGKGNREWKSTKD